MSVSFGADNIFLHHKIRIDRPRLHALEVTWFLDDITRGEGSIMYLIGCGMEEELSQVRSSRNLLEERMENELEQIRQELSDKEAIINEQRTTTEAQRRAFEEDLNLAHEKSDCNQRGGSGRSAASVGRGASAKDRLGRKI